MTGKAIVGAQVEAIRAAFAVDDDLRDYAQQTTLRPGDPWRVEGEVTSLAARRKAVRIARRTVRDADIEDGVRLEPRVRRSDDRLAATLREALAGELAFQDVRIVAPGGRPPHLGEPWLGILVHYGDVFLGGRLDLARKSLAEALAWETGSCCDVHNLVSHDPPRQGRDAEVAQALHTLVDEHSGVDGDRVEIRVEQGTVALLGEVADEGQRRKVKAPCWLLPDVFEVHDHLVVRQRA